MIDEWWISFHSCHISWLPEVWVVAQTWIKKAVLIMVKVKVGKLAIALLT